MKLTSCSCTVEDSVSSAEIVVRPASTIRIPETRDNGLLGYWPFSSLSDISGNGNDLVAITEPAAFDTLKGVLCSDARFVRRNAKYSFPFQLGESWTISAWVRPQKDQLEQTLISIGNNIRLGFSWQLEPIIWLNERESDEAIISADAIESGSLTQVVFSREGDEFQIYIAGDPVDLKHDGTESKPAMAKGDKSLSDVYLFKYRNTGGFFGAVQDIAIRNEQLFPDEVNLEFRSYCEMLYEESSVEEAPA